MIRRTLLGFLALALAASSIPAIAQPSAALNIARIFHIGPLKVGNNTFRVTVRNGSSTGPIQRGEDVIVKLIVLDPNQQRSEYEARITTGIGTNGDQTAAFPNVMLHAAGPHTVTAGATTNFAPGRANAVARDRTQVFNVGGAQADAANQLTVLVKRTSNNTPVANVRVSLKADNRELDWKQTGGTGEARFPRVAPSPDGRPYTIEVRAANNLIGTFEYAMPAQASVFEAKVNP
jgi:hypothetical protein